MKYSNFKITHIVDRGKIHYPLTVATLDITEPRVWFLGLPKTRTITVFNEYYGWRFQETGMYVSNELQAWLDAQETLACIPTD